jgi:hypothetical protein
MVAECDPADQTVPHVESASSTLEGHKWLDTVLTDGTRLGEVTSALQAQSRIAGEYLSVDQILNHASQHAPVESRVRHLDALADLLDSALPGDVCSAILAALDEWREQFAVADWRRARLPQLIAAHLPSFARYLPWEAGRLEAALRHSDLTDEQAQVAILQGIERHSGQLGAAVTFALGRQVALRLPATEAATLCRWYLDRLALRIVADDLENIDPDSIPKDADVAVARFLFAYLGDIDVRQRWRAAHSLRRLARLGAISTLSQVVAENERRRELAFRDPGAPFYWLAARLWLVISLDRIASETPRAAAPHGAWLLDTALSDHFPHLLIREYAADACRTLVAAEQLNLTTRQARELRRANRSRLPRGTTKRAYGQSFEGRGRPQKDEARRFHFDFMDTLRYWYEPWLRVFEDLRPGAFLEAAERWIVDEWKVTDEDPYGSPEPRKNRFSDRDWTLTHASHGSRPTIERYRTYLEWHAMWCAAGELLKSHRVSRPDGEGDDPLDERLFWEKPSVPGVWVADLVGPRPSEPHQWRRLEREPKWHDEVLDERCGRRIERGSQATGTSRDGARGFCARVQRGRPRRL